MVMPNEKPVKPSPATTAPACQVFLQVYGGPIRHRALAHKYAKPRSLPVPASFIPPKGQSGPFNFALYQYHLTAAKYRKFSQRLTKRLKNHTLQELSFKSRNRLFSNHRTFKTPPGPIQLQLKLGVAGASLCLSIGVLQEGLGAASLSYWYRISSEYGCEQ